MRHDTDHVGQETAASTLAKSLKRHGIDTLFGQSLPSALHLVAPDFGMHQVNYRTENAGGAMADGYARISNRIGVVTAQNGPAATLLVPPLAEAMKASVPLLAIVQEVDRASVGRNAFQEFDHFALFAACAKSITRIDIANRVEDHVDIAIATATTGRPGPVVLLCPADMLNETRDAIERRAARLGHFPLDRVCADPDRLEEAAELIAGAKAPVVIAGGGVHLSKAAEAVARLQDAASLPVGTTNMGKGSVDETHALSLGVLANALGRGSPARHMRPLLEEADVVLLIGTRTNQNGTDSWKLYPPKARFIHIDIDGTEVGRNYEALRLVGDARLTVDALTKALENKDLTVRSGGRDALAERIDGARRAGRDEASTQRSDAAPLRPERIMAEIDARLTPDTIVTADASYASLWVSGFLTARAVGQRFVTPRGLAGLGWGLPLALGAKAAARDAKVICVVGDGGFGHSWQELETAHRMGLDVVVILLNNGILGFQKHAEVVKFGAHTNAIDFETVDHVAIARATGCQSERVESVGDLSAALDAALARSGTTLIDVDTAPDAYPPIAVFEGKLKDGR